MSCYEALASSYDALTEDVGYEKRADFLEKLFRREKIFVVALENIGWFDRKHLFYLVFTGVGDAFFVLIQQFT